MYQVLVELFARSPDIFIIIVLFHNYRRFSLTIVFFIRSNEFVDWRLDSIFVKLRAALLEGLITIVAKIPFDHSINL